MAPSDSWTCWDDGQGNVLCEDQTCTSEDPCPRDAIDNLVILTSQVSAGFWEVTYERILVSPDPADTAISPDTVPMIFCKGPGSGTSAPPTLKHPFHGSFRITWGSATQAAVEVGTPTPVQVARTGNVTQGAPVELVPGMVVKWHLNAERTAAVFSMRCRLGEYCALGLSPSGNMAPSDSWTCWDDGQGQVVCEDQTCINTDPCLPDGPLNVLSSAVGARRRGRVLANGVANGFWEVTYERLVNPTDSRDMPMPLDVAPLIFCVGTGSGSAAPPTLTHYSHGTAAVNWATGGADIKATTSRSSVHVFASLGMLAFYALCGGVAKLTGMLRGFGGDRVFLLVTSVVGTLVLAASGALVVVGDTHEYRGRDAAIFVGFGGAAQLFLVVAMLSPLKTFSPMMWTMDLPPERALWWHRW
eukprot:Hpha_TRINITY_DN15607_c0_g5::TRINITY_DN15607_c0_g5_i1::g.99518::m.99518